MGAVCEVQMPGDKIVDVVSVRHSLMPAVCTMTMSSLVSLATMGRGACSRVLLGDAELMFIDMVAVQMVQVPVM